jgi:hypothetical protein
MTSTLKNLLARTIHMSHMDIPKQQLAAVRVGEGANGKAPLQKIDVVLPGPNEVLVKINWSVERVMLYVPCP